MQLFMVCQRCLDYFLKNFIFVRDPETVGPKSEWQNE